MPQFHQQQSWHKCLQRTQLDRQTHTNSMVLRLQTQHEMIIRTLTTLAMRPTPNHLALPTPGPARAPVPVRPVPPIQVCWYLRSFPRLRAALTATSDVIAKRVVVYEAARNHARIAKEATHNPQMTAVRRAESGRTTRRMRMQRELILESRFSASSICRMRDIILCTPKGIIFCSNLASKIFYHSIL